MRYLMPLLSENPHVIILKIGDYYPDACSVPKLPDKPHFGIVKSYEFIRNRY